MAAHQLAKTATGIAGLDEVTGGGLPTGRPTLLCGSAGCGKTLFAMTFLHNGALAGEPGVLMSFEERAADLAVNVASLGVDVDALIADRKLVIDYVRIERAEIEESGDYDLEGLFVRLGHAIDSIGAKRVVLDTIEALFGGFDNSLVLRAELRRLFSWLKDKGVTAIITGERGDGQLTRYGIEEYVSDCVILLDHRVQDQITTRRLRVVKYRGSAHGTNEYPFLIDKRGISVLPITAAGLGHQVSDEIVPTGVGDLDRDARPRQVVQGSECSHHRSCRDGQIDLRGGLCRRRRRARRSRDLLCLRGIARTDRAQHDLGRHRSAASFRHRAAPFRVGTAEPVRA